MRTLKRSMHVLLSLAPLLLLGACEAYQTSEVSPLSSRLVSVTTRSGSVVNFDTLPAAQITGDTVFGRQDGVPCAIPTSDVAATRWAAASGEQAATRATTGPARLTGLAVPTVSEGAHVRITAPSLGWYGTTKDVGGVRGDTLLVRKAGGLLGYFLPLRPVPLSAVTSLEVSVNHGAHEAAIIVGGLAGAIGGALAGDALTKGQSCDSSWAGLRCGINRMGNQLMGVFAGAALGDALGMLLGAAVVPERWTSASLRTRVGLVVQPDGRLGLGVSLAF